MHRRNLLKASMAIAAYTGLSASGLLAAQAFEFLKAQRFGAGTDAAWRLLRERVPAYDQDRWLAPDIAAAASVLKDSKLLHDALPNLH